MIISFPNFFKVNGVIITWIPWKIIEEGEKNHMLKMLIARLFITGSGSP